MSPFTSSSQAKWKDVANTKQSQRTENLDALPRGEVKTNQLYLAADAATIVGNIQAGLWTAELVLLAYMHRAQETHKALNCLTEVMFSDALKEARELDEEYQRTHQIRGPLHGVPCSVKDCFRVKGVDATLGYTEWANKPSEEDAELLQLIRAAGGIIIAKTNVPQTMLSFECSNPLWGRTLNPLKPLSGSPAPPIQSGLSHEAVDRPFTCGGSSGGEAALLACDGAVIGLGSDIGGSLRIPSAFCGTYTLKPSQGRTSGAGLESPALGFEAITVCQGPMARSIRDLRIAAKLLLGRRHSKVPLAYREEMAQSVVAPKKLKFGFYLSDGVVKASPACQRGVIEAVQALREQGHECIQFTPPNVSEALRIFVGLTSADAYRTRLSHLGSDPKEKSLQMVTLGPSLPGSTTTPFNAVRSMGAWAFDHIVDDDIFATALRASKSKDVKEFMEYVAARDTYNAMFEKHVWQTHGFDGIIAPVLASPALPHGATTTLSPIAIGTILYNVVDSSVGVLPVTRVDPAKDQLSDEWLKGSPLKNPLAKPSEHKSMLDNKNDSESTRYPPFESGPHGSKIWESGLYAPKGAARAIYDPETMAGLPVGIQVVGRIHEDEKVLEMMQIIEDALCKDDEARKEPSPCAAVERAGAGSARFLDMGFGPGRSRYLL
ncbi:amidase signature enzyme [Clavulina sp. PMI_390]|nr:amidase signature enzyme [Clavulina sp. PMI_390]